MSSSSDKQLVFGDREYFPGIGRIRYEGPESDDPLAFKYYDAERVIAGKPLREHLRFAVCYWHSFCGMGGDPFGPGTRRVPWQEGVGQSDATALAEARVDAAFEFFAKLGVGFYCFHDRDLAPEGVDAADSERRLQQMVERAGSLQQASGIRLLWGTANLFSHPRYMNGAATNPDFQVVAHAGAQVKAAIDATIALDGDGYVFWGGREGYFSLLNTDMKRELDHLGAFLARARDYARGRGFQGQLLIEPKPMEPTKHQYDFDVAAVVSFLQRYDLSDDFRLNIENNHATLAGHTFAHEVQTAFDSGLFGSLDVNQGDPHNGWDTDEFLVNLYDTVALGLVLLQEGGLGRGGMNFDAKVRRSSTDLDDLFIGHIHSMDCLARGLMVAAEIMARSDYSSRRRSRYESFDSGAGARFERGELDLEELAALAQSDGEPQQTSGKQEYFESLIGRYLR